MTNGSEIGLRQDILWANYTNFTRHTI